MYRDSTIHIGPQDDDLENALRERGLSPVWVPGATAVDESILESDARSLFIHVETENGQIDRNALARILRRMASPALNRGMNLGVVCRADTQQQAAAVLSNFAGGRQKTRMAAFDPDQGIARVANFAARYDAGREPSQQVSIEGVTDANHITLFRRAFNDFARVYAVPLRGAGAATSGVWRVLCDDLINGFRCEPFAVKIAQVPKVDAEISNYRLWAEFRVPFTGRAPLAYSRCVQGLDEAAIVSLFVSRATRLDEFVHVVSPVLAVAALFDGPLSTWRSQTTQRSVQLAKLYGGCGRLFKRNHVTLVELYQELAAEGHMLPSPSEIHDAMTSFREVDVSCCHSHGDLHARNVYVRENATDPILIDFAAANYDSPVARDPVTLEVSLAFDCPAPLDVETLRALYRPDVLDARSQSDDGRVQAINQIRLQARATCANADEYDITAAIFLMRAACRQRSHVAYELAVKLMRHVGVI